MSILVTGGAGFIGSHTCVELLNAGYDVVVADNLYNASEKALDRVKEITGKDLKFYKADIRDREAMNEVFEKEDIESVIHFAGLKAVGESVQKPLEFPESHPQTLQAAAARLKGSVRFLLTSRLKTSLVKHRLLHKIYLQKFPLFLLQKNLQKFPLLADL